MKCPNCGMRIDVERMYCFKCDVHLKNVFADEIMQVDVAHNNETWPDARDKIDSAVRKCRRLRLKGLKIIHGRGSRTGHTRIIADQAVPYLEWIARKHNCRLVQDKYSNGAHIVYFNSSR